MLISCLTTANACCMIRSMKTLTTTVTTTTCKECEVRCQRFGTHRNGLQRFRCPACKKTYTEEHKHLIEDMNLADEKAACPSTLRRRQLATEYRAHHWSGHQHADEALGEGRREVREGNGEVDRQHPGEGCSVRRNLGLRSEEGRQQD